MRVLLIFLVLQYVSFTLEITSNTRVRFLNLKPNTVLSAHVSSPTWSTLVTQLRYKELSKYIYVPDNNIISTISYAVSSNSSAVLGNGIVTDAWTTQVTSSLGVVYNVQQIPSVSDALRGVASLNFFQFSAINSSVTWTVANLTVVTPIAGNWTMGRRIPADPSDPSNVVQTITVVTSQGTLTLKYPFFPGRVYSLYLTGLPNSNKNGLEIVVVPDTGFGNPALSETFENLCLNITCPPDFTCRSGRCLNVTEKCRDYSGFDVVEVARDVLIYVDGQIQAEINNTITRLQRLRLAVDRYDPNTRRLNLIPYLRALDAFCGGRNCTDTDCANPNSGCTTLECQYPNSGTCPGLRQIEFLQAAFLGAVASLNPGASCLAPYTAL